MTSIKKILFTWLNSDGNTDYHISDIPVPLWSFIKRRFYAVPAVIIVGIISSIVLKDFLSVLLFLAIALLILYHGLILIKDWYSNKIEVISAVMFQEVEAERVHKVMRSRRYLLLMCQNKSYLKVFVPDSFKPELGNEVDVYAYKDAFRRANDDTTIVSNHLVVKITKQLSDMDIVEDAIEYASDSEE